MKNSILRTLVIVAVMGSLLGARPAVSQIMFSGSLDLEVSHGEEDSRFITNGLTNEYRRAHLSVNQLNLFAFSQIDDNFSVNTRLAWHTWGTGQLNDFEVLLAELTWQPPDSDVGITVGRYLSPFGLYPKRQLAMDNSLVNAPLLYEYFVNISDHWGYWPTAGESGTYDGSTDVGLNTLYFGGYLNGGMAAWSIVPNKVQLDVGLSNVAPASAENFSNLATLAGVARLGLRPTYFWEQGISLSHGSFMRLNNANRQWDGIGDFTQTVVGLDWILAYSYFELSGEFVYSRWKVPAWEGGEGFVLVDGNYAEFDLENYGAYVDLRYEPPFLTGSYVTVRAEQLAFQEYDYPADWKQLPTAGETWDDDVTRLSIGVGYMLSRFVLIKGSYLVQETDIPEDPQDNAARLILTAMF